MSDLLRLVVLMLVPLITSLLIARTRRPAPRPHRPGVSGGKALPQAQPNR